MSSLHRMTRLDDIVKRKQADAAASSLTSQEIADKNIIEQMIRQQGFTIKQQINHYKTICNDIHDRKNRKQGIWASDYELFGVAIYALRKLRYIDDDLHALDGICFFPPYKKS